MKLYSYISGNKNQLVDIHVHSHFSDGMNSIDEIVKAAVEKKLEVIAFTDHVWRTSEWINKYFDEIKKMRIQYPQLHILAGLEAKVINCRGDVDVNPDVREKVDFIMGVVHRFLPEENIDLAQLLPQNAAKLETELILRMLDKEHIDIIGHPMRTYYKFHYGKSTDKIFPQEMILEIIKKGVQVGKPLEYNSKLPFRETFLKMLCLADAQFILGTDSHALDEFRQVNHRQLFEEIENMKRELRCVPK